MLEESKGSVGAGAGAGAGRENPQLPLIQSIIEKAAQLRVDLEDSLTLAYSNEWKKYITGREKGAVFNPRVALAYLDEKALQYLKSLLDTIDLKHNDQYGRFPKTKARKKNGVFVNCVKTNLEGATVCQRFFYFHCDGYIALAGLRKGLSSEFKHSKKEHFKEIARWVRSSDFSFDRFKDKADAYVDAERALAASIEEETEREKKAALAELDAEKQLQTLRDMAKKEGAKTGSQSALKKSFAAYDLAQQADGFGADAGAGSEGASGASSDEKEWDQLLKQMKATHLMLHFSINEGQLQYVISNQNKPLSSENLTYSRGQARATFMALLNRIASADKQLAISLAMRSVELDPPAVRGFLKENSWNSYKLDDLAFLNWAIAELSRVESDSDHLEQIAHYAQTEMTGLSITPLSKAILSKCLVDPAVLAYPVEHSIWRVLNLAEYLSQADLGQLLMQLLSITPKPPEQKIQQIVLKMSPRDCLDEKINGFLKSEGELKDYFRGELASYLQSYAVPDASESEVAMLDQALPVLEAETAPLLVCEQYGDAAKVSLGALGFKFTEPKAEPISMVVKHPDGAGAGAGAGAGPGTGQLQIMRYVAPESLVNWPELCKGIFKLVKAYRLNYPLYEGLFYPFMLLQGFSQEDRASSESELKSEIKSVTNLLENLNKIKDQSTENKLKFVAGVFFEWVASKQSFSGANIERIRKIIERLEAVMCLEVARSIRALFKKHDLYALKTFPVDLPEFKLLCKLFGKNMHTGYGMTPLQALIHAQYVPEVRCVKRMLDAHADPDCQFLHAAGDGMHYAVLDSNLALLKLFVEAGAKPQYLHIYNGKTTTALLAATENGALPVVKYCVEELGVDVNQVYPVDAYTGYETMSLLLDACLKNQPTIAAYLMTAGANLDLIITLQGGFRSPLRQLLESRTHRSIKLAARKLSLKASSSKEEATTPSQTAMNLYEVTKGTQKGNFLELSAEKLGLMKSLYEVVSKFSRLLLDAGNLESFIRRVIDIDESDPDPDLMFRAFSEFCHSFYIALTAHIFNQEGVCMDISLDRLTRPYTLMHIAIMRGREDILRFCVDYLEMDIHTRTWCDRSYTPLHLAVLYDQFDMIKCLLEDLGAGINQADSLGETALHLAYQKKSASMVELLKGYNPDERLKNADLRKPDAYLTIESRQQDKDMTALFDFMRFIRGPAMKLNVVPSDDPIEAASAPRKK